MAEPTPPKPRRITVPQKGATTRARVTLPVDPHRSTGGKALGKTKGKAQGKAVGHTKPQPKSLGPETAAVRKKYESTLAMRKEAAAGKGAKGKAGLIAWKRSSGYQKDWNAAKANDLAASKPRPTTGDFDPKHIAFVSERAKQLRESGQGKTLDRARLDTRMGAKPGSGVEEFKPIGGTTGVINDAGLQLRKQAQASAKPMPRTPPSRMASASAKAMTPKRKTSKATGG